MTTVPFDKAVEVGDGLGLNWDTVDKYTFHMALNEELGEHRDVLGESPESAGKVVMAHLREDPHYYQHHEIVSHAAEEFWRGKQKPPIVRGGGEGLTQFFLFVFISVLVLLLIWIIYKIVMHYVREGLMPGDPNRNILRRSRAPYMKGRYPEGGLLDYYFQSDPSMVGDSFDACWTNPVACRTIGLA